MNGKRSEEDEFACEVERRVACYELPPANFDPLTASDELLERYGVPPRPRSADDPDLCKFWMDMFARPLRFVRPEFKIHVPESIVARERRSPSRRRPSRRLRLEGSRNWSGACLTPRFPARFTRITGAWHVPSADVPAVAPPPPVPEGREFRSSTWVGFGGHRTHPGSSLPQAGTAQRVKEDGAGTTVYPWWQWWSNIDGGLPEVEIANIPTTVWDLMCVSLTAKADDLVQFNVKNQTTGLFTAFLVRAPQGSEPVGASAEWIMERPAEFGSTWLYRLPHCSDVVFRGCTAQSRLSNGDGYQSHGLDHPQMIRMYEVFEGPHRKAYVSVPTLLTRSSLRIRYKEAMP